VLSKISISDFLKELNLDSDKPSEVFFSIRFDCDHILFSYSATIDCNSECYSAETIHINNGNPLTVVETKGEKRILHSIMKNDKGVKYYGKSVNNILFMTVKDIETMKVFYKNPDKSFEKTIEMLIRLNVWFKNLTIIGTQSHIQSIDNPKLVSSFINSMDAGVYLEVKETTGDPISQTILQSMRVNGFGRQIDVDTTRTSSILFQGDYYFVKNYKSVFRLLIKHKNGTGNLSLSSLSEGQQRLFWLSILVTDMSDDVVFIVDEIDRKLHTNATIQLLKLFKEKKVHSQHLIITSHESELFNTDLIARDNIWIVDRSGGEGSFLYSLPEQSVFTDIRQSFIDNTLLD
jgi:hypothetical protein